MRRRAQRQAAKAGRWQVVKKSRWTVIHSRRVYVELVRESGEAKLKATDVGTV